MTAEKKDLEDRMVDLDAIICELRASNEKYQEQGRADAHTIGNGVFVSLFLRP